LLSVAIIIVVVALSALVVSSLLTHLLYFPHEATVPPPTPEPKIKMFSDDGCTLEVANGTTINWGTVSVGANTITYWIKNTGNCDVTLSLTTAKSPSGWNLSWDYDGTAIIPADVRRVKITLTVPTDASAGTYGWDSWITAEQA